jgi:hypothetical protein
MHGNTHVMKLRNRKHFAKVPEYREDVIMSRLCAFFNIRHTKRKTKRKTPTKKAKETITKPPLEIEKELCESGNVDAFDDMISPIDSNKTFPEPILSNPNIEILTDFTKKDMYSTSTTPQNLPSPKTPTFKSPLPSILSLSTRRKDRISRVEFVKTYMDQNLDVALPKSTPIKSPSTPQREPPSIKSPQKTPQEYPPNLNYFVNYLQWPPMTCKLKF